VANRGEAAAIDHRLGLTNEQAPDWPVFPADMDGD
jgi:hypothetical protein